MDFPQEVHPRETTRGTFSKFFYINENGAENAALIQSWSFHLTPKTHHDQGTPWPAIGDSGIGRNPNRRHVPWPWGGSERTKWGSPPYAPKRLRRKMVVSTNKGFAR
jgi:hypothetical protein